MEDQTFPVTINDRRIRATYKKDGMHHVYSSPDLNGASFFATDKDKAYKGFVRRAKELTAP